MIIKKRYLSKNVDNLKRKIIPKIEISKMQTSNNGCIMSFLTATKISPHSNL